MGHARFLLFTAMGAAIWNSLLILGGQWLENTFARADDILAWGTIVLGIATVAFYLWRVMRWNDRDQPCSRG